MDLEKIKADVMGAGEETLAIKVSVQGRISPEMVHRLKAGMASTMQAISDRLGFTVPLIIEGDNFSIEAVDIPKADSEAEKARALHRVVRAMHDGHCPACGFLGASEDFKKIPGVPSANPGPDGPSHKCPACGFQITFLEALEALQAFRPYLEKSLEVFEEWRAERVAS